MLIQKKTDLKKKSENKIQKNRKMIMSVLRNRKIIQKKRKMIVLNSEKHEKYSVMGKMTLLIEKSIFFIQNNRAFLISVDIGQMSLHTCVHTGLSVGHMQHSEPNTQSL